jgi:hypothetical protein
MKVILKQSGRGWIDLCIEFSDFCITICTSSSFDPYERLYIWLGKIRDLQLPEKMVIDEEGLASITWVIKTGVHYSKMVASLKIGINVY